MKRESLYVGQSIIYSKDKFYVDIMNDTSRTRSNLPSDTGGSLYSFIQHRKLPYFNFVCSDQIIIQVGAFLSAIYRNYILDGLVLL